MNTTKEQQKKLDDALVTPENHLKIGKSNLDDLGLPLVEIKFLSDVNVNHMHQPWRSFTSIINKCLSGKTIALENLVFQVENKNSKKNNDMYYPRFTKVIVDYFMAKDQAIPRRNKIIDNHAMLSSNKLSRLTVFLCYSVEMAPKSKAIKKKTDSESSPKTKPSQASKGKRIKTLAKGDKPATTKSKGLTVLSEVALSEAEQMKLATKRSLKEFHISHASGSGDGVDILSKVPDEQQQTRSGTNEGAGDKPEVPDVPEYRSESEEESWTFSQGEDEEEDEEHDSDDDNDDNDDEDDDQENDSQRTKSDDEGDDFVHPNLSTYIADDQEKEKEEEKADDDDDDDVTSDQKVSTPPDYELTEEDENKQDDDTMGEEQGDEDNGELYGDLNINLSRSDAEMTDAQTNPETEEAQVTLTTEPPVVQLQSSSASSDLVAKFINPSPDTGIDSILNPNAAVSVTPSSATIIPQTPIPIIQPQQQTHDSTTTTTIPTTTMPEIPNFASLFGFEPPGVSSLDYIRQLREEDLNLYRALLEAYSSDKDILSSYGEAVTLKRGHLYTNHQASVQMRSRSQGDALMKNSLEFDTGNDDVSPVREATDVDERLWNPSGSRTPDGEWNQTKTNYHSEQVFKATNDQLDWHNPEGRPYCDNRGLSRLDNQSIERDRLIGIGFVLDFVEFISFTFGDKEMISVIEAGKLTNLNVDERFALNVALRMYTRRIVIQERVEDLQLAVESYQKKINLTKPDTYRSDISKKTPYTAYRDIQGIIYQDDMDRNRLMRTDELHKFSDGTLNHVRTSLNDIATGIQMEYLPKRKWSKQDKQRA
ncbi:hypothetical protein Tco_0653882 [Tanacetum coccineum]|uniref:Uncharacterized protein n=1 Tax=Tanacetum coccineum TaxID=301880 RepID=A0ABQ4X1N6_9ASTR